MTKSREVADAKATGMIPIPVVPVSDILIPLVQGYFKAPHVIVTHS